MIFEQFYLKGLGHASYLVGDEATGRALVLDPQRNVDGYFEAARQHGLRISYAVDTHGHNDYLSGLTELSTRQDVKLLGFEDAELGYEHQGVKDGEFLEMGDVAFEVLHTPGHTPEHISLLVYDRTVGDTPGMMLSGGALLVGDIARPDLLGGKEDATAAAKIFCFTIQEKILWRLDDEVEVFPTHVSGSLCGGNIGSRLSTTVGFERKTNEVLARVSSSEEFVEECIRMDNLPAVPPYWRRMRSQNMAGPPPLGVLGEPPALRPEDVEELRSGGAIVLDTRSTDAFAASHIPGSLSVGAGPQFPTWAGTVLLDDDRAVLVLEHPDDLWAVTWDLLRIGARPPVGWLAGGLEAWRTSGRDTTAVPQLEAAELAARLGEIEVLDVRQPAEWAAGHVKGARFITGAQLPERVAEVGKGPVAVMCGAGFRSAVAASVLLRHGVEVLNLKGGMAAWSAGGHPTE